MMATVPLHKAPLSENGRLALLRLEKLAARQASQGDYIGTEDVESILRVVRELAESEATLLTARPATTAEDAGDKYAELIYAVASKFQGETRHETALRYIRERENSANEGGAALATETPPSGS